MHPIDIRKYKIELREKSRQRRKQLNPAEKRAMDASIAEQVRRLYQYRAADVIMVYVSTPIEVDTLQIIENAFRDKKKVAVPRCIPKTRQMEFHYITSIDQLTPGTFSVLEPPAHYPIVTDFSHALMLVPGFLFDCFGYRLGYGKGYYDRYMKLHPELTAVAFAYDYQVLPEISCESFDERPDQLLTPSEIYSFMEKNIG